MSFQIPVAINLLPAEIFVYFLVFARLGGLFMMIPGLGDQTVPARVRLLLALATMWVLAPIVEASVPGLPLSVLLMAGLVAGEFLIGIAMGAIVRLFFAALQMAGGVIAFQSSLAMAQNFDPSQGTQGAILGTFLALLGTTLIFVTDMHHLMLAGFVNSYDLFPPGRVPPIADLSEMALRTWSEAFLVAIQMSSPFLAFGIVFYLAAGLLSKLMPQLQIFFLVMPANLILSFGILALTLSAIMMWWLEGFERVLMYFAGGG